MGRNRNRPEQSLHAAVVDHLLVRAPADCFWWHHPGGGVRSKTEAAIFRRLGTKAGLPDLFLLYQSKLYGLELKTEQGRLTNQQRTCHAALRAAGAIVGVAFGLND